MAETPEHAQQGGAPAPILPTERVMAVGMPGTGKSELLLSLWADDPGQRLLVDVQNAYELGPAALDDPNGCCEVHGNPKRIDWDARTIRYVPARAGKAARQEYDDLYAAIWARGAHWQTLGHLTVLLDESRGPTTEGYSPDFLELVLTQGRKVRIRHMAGMQRPVGVSTTILETADHSFVFLMGSRRDDLDAIGQRFGWNGREVGDELQALAEEHGYTDADGRLRCHAYLRHRMGGLEVHAFPPLPASTLARTRLHVINDT